VRCETHLQAHDLDPREQEVDGHRDHLQAQGWGSEDNADARPAGEVVKTQSPGCKTGAASRNAFVAHLVRHSFRRGGKLIFQNTVVVKFCGEFAGADDLQARANGMVVFRVRDTGEQPLPTERRPSLAEMG